MGSGPNELLDGDQLQTKIALERGPGNAAARNLARVQSKSAQSKGAKALLDAYNEISSFTEAIHAGNAVAEAAKRVYKLVDDGKALSACPTIRRCPPLVSPQRDSPRSGTTGGLKRPLIMSQLFRATADTPEMLPEGKPREAVTTQDTLARTSLSHLSSWIP